LCAYRTEREELKTLYETGYISQYIYLDMLNRLYDMRETLRLGDSELDSHRESSQQSFFQKMEDSFLRKTRELRWFSRVLSKYQGMRMIQQLQRNLAHVLMCDSVTAMLDTHDELDKEARKRVRSIYKERKKHYRRRLKLARKQFPSFYRRYIEQLATRSIINSGWNHVKAEFQNDDLGTKGFLTIQRRVQEKLAHISVSEPTVTSDEDTLADMLEDVELFDDLSDEDRNYLEKNASSITFLPGDVIMGAYEKGDNFYVILQGKASVWRTDALSYRHRVADLSDGDIMGESSLLAGSESGRHFRSATINAETPCAVLKVAMRPMLTILKKYPEIENSIREIHDARGADSAPKITDD
jgi:hypothetical protein